MRIYYDEGLEITIEMEKDWHVIEDKDAMKSHFGFTVEEAEVTPFVLIKMVDEKLVDSAMVTVDMVLYEGDEAYEKGLAANVQAVLDGGAKEVSRTKSFTRDGARIDHIVFQGTEGEYVSQRFVHINDLLVCFSIDVDSPGNAPDREIMNMILSMKLVPDED